MCEYKTLAQGRRQMYETETGESEEQPPWAASEPAVEERGIHVERRTKRERQKQKADQKGHSINLMGQAFLTIRLKKDGVGRGGVSQSDPGLFPFSLPSPI